MLLNTRSPEEYRGELVAPPHEMNHGAERTGRIPGAIHLYYQELLNDDDTYKSPDELKAIFAASGLSPDGGDEIVGYCRLTHRATFTWFAMRDILGFDNVKLYDGSWTDWGSIVGFPGEK
ncbi:MAG: rhodanese-like domain-containing protein [Rhodospirillaceae bacterium]